MSTRPRSRARPEAPGAGMPSERQVLFWLGALVVFVLLLWLLSEILLPFVVGFAIAYLLTPLTDRLERVGVHDNFFELGGHSLLATKVVSKSHRLFQTDIPLRRLFETPTVAGLAEHIQSGSGQPSAVPALTPGPRSENPPLSFAQQRLWFLDQWEPGSSFYNVPIAFRISGLLGQVYGNMLIR